MALSRSARSSEWRDMPTRWTVHRNHCSCLALRLRIRAVISGLPSPIDTDLPDQKLTLTIDRCATNPAIRTIGQLLELSKPINLPNRIGQTLKAALDLFKRTLGEAAWRDALNQLHKSYSELARDRKLLEPRDDGWYERQRFRDLAKIEEASVMYLRDVTQCAAEHLLQRQQAATLQELDARAATEAAETSERRRASRRARGIH